jgi:hypothetical protein
LEKLYYFLLGDKDISAALFGVSGNNKDTEDIIVKWLIKQKAINTLLTPDIYITKG